MPTDIDRETVRQKIEEGVPLVEVLPAEEYEEEHIVGAINLSLTDLDAEAAGKAGLHPDRPVIVYCNDYQ